MSGEATPEKTIKKGSPRKATPKSDKKKKLTKKDLKDPEAPQRAKSAFMYFGDAVRPPILARLKQEAADAGKKFEVAAVGRAIAEQWKTATSEQKAEAERKAAQDKERVEKERKAYQESGKEKAWKEKVKAMKASGDYQKVRKVRKIRPKVLKDLQKKYNKPERVMSAYFLYMLDNQKKLMEEGFKDMTARGTEAARRFKALAPPELKVYEDKVAANKAKHAEDMKAWQASGKEKEFNDAVQAAMGAEKDRKNKIKERKAKTRANKKERATKRREKGAKKKAAKAKKSISKKEKAKKGKGKKKKSKKESSSEEESDEDSSEEESESEEDSSEESDSDSSEEDSSEESESESESESSEPKKKKKKKSKK